MENPKTQDFFKILNEKAPELLRSLGTQVSACGYPVYCSLDVRDAGYKVAVVDVNLFPAGFNRLSKNDHERASKHMREFFAAKLLRPSPSVITVVPEAHTNNMGYLENLAGILALLRRADCEPKLLWPGPPISKAWKVTTKSGVVLEYLPAAEALEGSHALLLNHDLSGGIPRAIEGVHLPTFPSTRLGWYRRRKSDHFQIIKGLLAKLQNEHAWFDPWYFSTQTQMMANLDFDSPDGFSRVADKAEEMFATIESEHKERGIQAKPHLFVKNDAGTYGIGVFSVSSPSQIREASRKLREKMRKGKESVPIRQVILQEAVPTALLYTNEQGAQVVAETTLYLINGQPVGGFLRLNENLNENAATENLNQPGSQLEPLECPNQPNQPHRPFPKVRGAHVCEQLGSSQVYGFLARLHAVAAGLEECP